MKKLDPTQNPLAASLVAIVAAAATFAASEQWIDQGTYQALVQLAGIVIPSVLALGVFHLKGQTNIATAQHAVAAAHVDIAAASREYTAKHVEAQKGIVVNVQEAPKPATRTRKGQQ